MQHMQRLQSERVISSSIVDCGAEAIPPEETITYVEIPVYEDRIIEKPRREIIEIEKRIPKYNYEYVERIVEIPQVQTVTKQVEVPEYREVVKHVAVKQVVDVTKEVIKYVPRVEVRVVEKEVEVPGEMIEIPKPYIVENQIILPRYLDSEVPTVVAQKVQPVVTESATETLEVDLRDYDPYLVPVDVYVPRPVQRNLIPSGKQEEHRMVDVPVAQYNSLVKNLNQHVCNEDADGLYRKAFDGSVPMLHGPGSEIIPPVSGEWKVESSREDAGGQRKYSRSSQASSSFRLDTPCSR